MAVVPGIARCRLCEAGAEDVHLVRVRVFRARETRDYSVCERCIAEIEADRDRRRRSSDPR